MDAIQFSVQQSAGKETGSTAHPTAEPEKDTAGLIREKLEEAREKAQERRDSLKLKPNPRQYGDVAMTAYARLARAKNQGEVTAAAGYARRQIARCRAALGTDKDNATRIKAAINQLRKAVSRAGKKSRDLQREDLIRARAKRAQQEERRRKAAGLNQELNRRRTLRMIREGGYLREADVDNRQQEQIAKTELELRQQAQALGEAVTPSVEGTEYAAQAAAPAPEVQMDIQA